MDTADYRPERVGTIASMIQERLEESITGIVDIHERSHVISINARIEAVRSGQSGVGFRVVAEEFSRMNNAIREIADDLGQNIHTEITRLTELSEGMVRQVRGERLSQIALSVMDVIDRNLYERTCDVRWWATDDSVVSALKGNRSEVSPDGPAGTRIDEDAFAWVSRRLGVILDSYTVYHDIVLADGEGIVVANGRPETFKSTGMNVSKEHWFAGARHARADEYSFQSTHSSPLVSGAKALVYGCRVADGALGVVFSWDGLVRAVIDRVQGIDLKADIEKYKIPTVISIVDQNGTTLASSDEALEGHAFPADELKRILESRTMGFAVTPTASGARIYAWGYSPGFETYSTGWYCIISQDIR